MLFPPYIAQPCKLACCRPISSTSVPRYSQDMNLNLNQNPSKSYSLIQNQAHTPPPPRPPPVGYAHSQSLAEKPRDRRSYTMVPIIKPASSMPSGLAPTVEPAAPMMPLDDSVLAMDGSNSQYHSSQPNLMSQSYLNSNLNGGSTSAVDQTNHSNAMRGFQPGPSVVSRYGLRSNAQVERRTTPYYYHELLLQKNLFDSSLNLLPQQQQQHQPDLAKSKNSNVQLEQQQQQQQQHQKHLADASNASKRAPMAKPQQRLISNGQGRSNYSSSGSLSNLLGNGHGLSNGHESSDGTLVDEGSFTLAFNNLTNQIASLNNSSSLNNNNCSTSRSINNNSNSHNINANNNNSHVNNADSNNNVGQSNECIA